MKIAYTVSEHRSAKAEVELDLATEIAWDMARSDTERRAAIEAAVVAHAEKTGGWMYGRQVDFGVVPDDEEDEP